MPVTGLTHQKPLKNKEKKFSFCSFNVYYNMICVFVILILMLYNGTSLFHVVLYAEFGFDLYEVLFWFREMERMYKLQCAA